MLHVFARAFARISSSIFFLVIILSAFAIAQSGGSSGTISGTVVDPSGAVVSGATVNVHNPVSGLDRSTKTDNTGSFSFVNLPLNPYHLSVTAEGFAQTTQDI